MERLAEADVEVEVKLDSKATPMIEQLILKYDDMENYYEFKDLNRVIMLFFKGINNKQVHTEAFPEYKEFYNLSEDYYIENYGDLENVFYEIVSINKVPGRYFLNIRYKEEGSNKNYTSIFSTDGTYVVDEPFIRIDEISKKISNDKFSINVSSKAVYDKKSVYKIEVINLVDEFIEIESTMYGFYGKNTLNKYSHKLVKNSSIYKVLPFTNNIYFVEIRGEGIEELYINIDGEEIRLI